MDHVLRCVSPTTQCVAETQTDITVAQTPVNEYCPNSIIRPNFLPLSNSSTNQAIKSTTTNTSTMSSDV